MTLSSTAPPPRRHLGNASPRPRRRLGNASPQLAAHGSSFVDLA
ncbi:hypothetical protein [Actinoplanes sp. NPDC026670]